MFEVIQVEWLGIHLVNGESLVRVGLQHSHLELLGLLTNVVRDTEHSTQDLLVQLISVLVVEWQIPSDHSE